MTPRTIRLIKPCEFGEPGDLITPEPSDVATLLVETRGVAIYEDSAQLSKKLIRRGCNPAP